MINMPDRFRVVCAVVRYGAETIDDSQSVVRKLANLYAQSLSCFVTLKIYSVPSLRFRGYLFI